MKTLDNEQQTRADMEKENTPLPILLKPWSHKLALKDHFGLIKARVRS